MVESDEVFRAYEGEIIAQVETTTKLECKSNVGGGVRMTFTHGTSPIFEAVLSESAAVLLAAKIVDGK